jgi:hypothetical protein
MNRIQASEERLAQTLAMSADVLKLHGANLHEDGTLVRGLPEMYKGIPIADEVGAPRRHMWTGTASQVWDTAPRHAMTLGILRDAGLVNFVYEPKCYESKPDGTRDDVAFLLGPSLHISVETPDAQAVEAEHCITYANETATYFSTYFALNEFPPEMSAHQIAEMPPQRLGYEECAAIEGLMMAIPLIVHGDDYANAMLGAVR